MTRSQLVLRLPSNSLCYREVVFCVKMRCSLEIVDEYELILASILLTSNCNGSA